MFEYLWKMCMKYFSEFLRMKNDLIDKNVLFHVFIFPEKKYK